MLIGGRAAAVLTRPTVIRPPREAVAAVFAGNGGSWYDVSDLSSLRQDSGGTGVVSVGDPVGFLADQSGNGRHLTNATPTQRPILAVIEGRYLLACDGVDDVLWHQTGPTTGSLNQGTDGLMLLAGRRDANSGAVYASTYLATTRYWRIAGIITNSRLTASVRGPGGNFQPIVAPLSAPLATYGVTTSQISATSTTTRSPDGTSAAPPSPVISSTMAAAFRLAGCPGRAPSRRHSGAAMPSISARRMRT